VPPPSRKGRSVTSPSREKGARKDSRRAGVPSRRPDVIVDFIFEDGLLFISVQNIGAAPALETSVSFSSRLMGVGGSKEISALPLFKKIAFLPPGKVITTFLDVAASYVARGEPTTLSARAAFRDDDGRRYTRVIRHDLEIYREVGYVLKPPTPGDSGPTPRRAN